MAEQMNKTSVEGAVETARRPFRVLVIVGSVRSQRMGSVILGWVSERLESERDWVVESVELADVELPAPSTLMPGGGAATALSARIAEADAFVFVTPEYNHGVPGSLKHAIDAHYREWQFKPAMIVAYGNQGGWLAAEQLRQVLAELHVVAVRRVVGLVEPWLAFDGDGSFAPSSSASGQFDVATRELRWWTNVLRTARLDQPYAGN